MIKELLKRLSLYNRAEKLEFNITTMDYIRKHRHCPICGQVIERETGEAYYHIYTPTRCQKDGAV